VVDRSRRTGSADRRSRRFPARWLRLAANRHAPVSSGSHAKQFLRHPVSSVGERHTCCIANSGCACSVMTAHHRAGIMRAPATVAVLSVRLTAPDVVTGPPTSQTSTCPAVLKGSDAHRSGKSRIAPQTLSIRSASSRAIAASSRRARDCLARACESVTPRIVVTRWLCGYRFSARACQRRSDRT
jgi:hypothetical protein